MSNYVTNRLEMIGTEEQILKVREQIKGDGENIACASASGPIVYRPLIDFNKINPTPQELIDAQNITKEQRAELLDNFGADNWYGWNIENWGTGNLAQEQYEESENIIWFETTESTPFSAIEELSFQFPDVKFEVKFADENFGNNVGFYSFLNGNCLDEQKPEDGSPEAIEIAIDIFGDEEYWLGDHICESIEDNDGELDDYQMGLLEIAHKRGFMFDNYPANALEALMEFAISDGQTERVKQIEELLNDSLG